MAMGTPHKSAGKRQFLTKNSQFLTIFCPKFAADFWKKQDFVHFSAPPRSALNI
jgi:hypothetical protein